MIQRRTIATAVLVLFLLAGFYSATAQVSSATSDSTSIPGTDRTQIESVLKDYVSAYEKNDYAGVVRAWPSLENDKKASKKLKERMDRADITETHLALDIEDISMTPNSAILRCKRSENFVQVERSSFEFGDATIGGMPAQRPGPTNNYAKKNVKKLGDVWIGMKRLDNRWVIDSMTDQKP